MTTEYNINIKICWYGIVDVFKILLKYGTSITIICKATDPKTVKIIKGLSLRGILNAELVSLLQLNTWIFF